MSLIKLQGNASGTGAFTIAAPNGNTDRTLTLPDATGTVVTADGSGNIATTSITPSSGIYLGGSGSANLLDDYEEGTWTPVFSQSGATISYGQQVGFYTKIGRLVHVTGRIETLSWSGGSGAIRISGLPFASVTTSPPSDMHTASIGVTFGGWSSTNAPRTGFMGTGASAIRLYTSDSSDARSQMDTEVTSVGDGSVGLLFNLVYTTT